MNQKWSRRARQAFRLPWPSLRDKLNTYRREACRCGDLGASRPDWVVLSRQLRPWLRSLQNGATPIGLGLPWITFTAIERLQQHLRPKMRVFEFGSGGSTVFFVRHGVVLYSVEHEPAWYQRVVNELAKKKIADHHLRLIEPEAPGGGIPGDPGDPESYATSDELLRNCTFRNYAASIDVHEPESFDLILVDGRSRPACLRHSVSRLKPGGLLVLDNSERLEYARGMALVDQVKWPRTDCIGPGPCNRYFWRTTIWQRPGDATPRGS